MKTKMFLQNVHFSLGKKQIPKHTCFKQHAILVDSLSVSHDFRIKGPKPWKKRSIWVPILRSGPSPHFVCDLRRGRRGSDQKVPKGPFRHFINENCRFSEVLIVQQQQQEVPRHGDIVPRQWHPLHREPLRRTRAQVEGSTKTLGLCLAHRLSATSHRTPDANPFATS